MEKGKLKFNPAALPGLVAGRRLLYERPVRSKQRNGRTAPAML